MRAAELALNNNYSHYSIVGGDGVGSVVLKATVPEVSWTYGIVNTSIIGNSAYSTLNARTYYSPASEWSSSPMPEGNILVKMFKNKIPKGAVNAKETYSRLKALML